MKQYFCAWCLLIILFFGAVVNAFAEQKSLNIALVLWRGETAAEKGFMDELNTLGYRAQFTIFNAEQEKSNLGKFLRQENQFSNFDYVYTFGTTVSKFISHVVKGKTPLVFNIVTEPVKAGVAKSMAASGRENVGGVSSKVPLELQLKNIVKIVKFKKLGMFFNPREKNSEIVRTDLVRLSEKMGFTVVPLRSPPAGTLFKENLIKVRDKAIDIDIVYFPSDSFLVSQAELIGKEMRKGKIISVGAIKKYIDKGVMLGTVTDYEVLGRLAAKIIDRHQNGEKLSDIPIQIQNDPRLIINKTTVDIVKIQIDADSMANALIVE